MHRIKQRSLSPMEIFDISVSLSDDTPHYPGDIPFARDLILSLAEKGSCNLSKIVMGTHSGTHLDMPFHFIDGGKTLDDYSLESFILTAEVIQINDSQAITAKELENISIEPGDAILFKTANSANDLLGRKSFQEKYVYLSAAAAEICIEKKVGLIGIDYLSIEEFGSKTHPAHKTVLGNGIPVLEGIILNEVEPGQYTLICLPLKLKGADGSPVRAILIK